MSEDSRAADVLASLEGSWVGSYRLWLEPGALRTECPTTCRGRSHIAGFTLLEYDWRDLDGPQSGLMVLAGPQPGRWEMAWVDSWHTGRAIMSSSGEAAAIDVLGSYGPSDNEWGWRTRIEVPTPDDLVVTAWNVTPDGVEAMATQATYSRTTAS